MVTERSVESAFRDFVKKQGGETIKLGVNGKPDRLVVMPEGKTGFAEIKQPKGKLTPKQRHEIVRLFELGHVVGVIWSRADFEPFLDRVRRGNASSIYRLKRPQ